MSHIFRIGDRVRIANQLSPRFGLEGVIYKYGPARNDLWGRKGNLFFVDVDGQGKGDVEGWFAYKASDLIPLSPPKSQISEILAMKDLPDFVATRLEAIAEGVQEHV